MIKLVFLLSIESDFNRCFYIIEDERRVLMNQNERFDYLIDSLKKESIRYKNLSMGNSTEEKRKVLRYFDECTHAC